MSLAAIIALIQAFLKAIGIADKWFSKTPTEKIEKGKEALDREESEFDETGRPPR